MTGKPRFTASDIIKALDQHYGMVYLAAKALKCSHQTIYNYAKKHPTVQEAIDRNRGHVIDSAEVALFDAILNREHWAVTFALKTIGKNRGYTEKTEQEISGPGGGPMGLVILPQKDDGDDE